MRRTALALAVACACSKPEPQRPQPTVTMRPGPTTAPMEMIVKPAPIVWSKDLAYLPVDSDLVFGVDLVRLRASELWQTYGSTITAKLETQLARIRADCGIDLFETISGVSGGSIDTGGTNAHSVWLLHGFPKKLEPCLGKPSWNGLAHAFVDDTTVLLASTQDDIDRAIKGASALPTSPAFTDLWKHVTTSGAGWFVANGNAQWLASLKSLAPDTKALLGSIDLTDRIALDGRLRLGAQSTAASLVQALTPQLPAAKALVERLDVTVDGSDIHVVVAATAEQIQGLVAQFASPAVQRDPKGH